MKQILTTELAKRLHKIFEPLTEKVNDINYGGCGVAAVAITKRLNELGFNTSIIACTDSVCTLDESKKNLPVMNRSIRKQRKNNTGIAGEFSVHSHYVVKCGRFYIDTDAIYVVKNGRLREIAGKSDFMYYKLGKVHTEDIAYLNTLSWEWNIWFNRSKIPVVEKYIQTKLTARKLAA